MKTMRILMTMITFSGLALSAADIQKEVKEKATFAGRASMRELILQIIASGAERKGVDFTKKVKVFSTEFIVSDNEIITDAVENGAYHFTKKVTAHNSEVDAVAGLVGFARAWFRSMVVANVVHKLRLEGVKNHVSDDVYGTLVLVGKGVGRIIVDSAVESGKAALSGDKKGTGAIRIGFGFTFN